MRYQLKSPCNNGSTHVVFEPLDFLAMLGALVHRPKVNLAHYHGVFGIDVQTCAGCGDTMRITARRTYGGEQGDPRAPDGQSGSGVRPGG